MRVADLIILSNVPQRYTYNIPDDITVQIGDFLDITFAKRQHIGLCVSINSAELSDFNYKLSDILSVHEKRARVPVYLIQLIEWFAEFYCVSEYKAFQCVVGLKKSRADVFTSDFKLSDLHVLSLEQNRIYESIRNASERLHLLHGVTGSGKTLIYAHLIRDEIAKGNSVIMLIPEISLTPQFTSFFSDLFDRVGVVHSGLTPKKKEQIWNQCLRGELDIVIGPRSAIFMPLDSLGVIIIDEEHDSSYKQESSPRYFTHDVAIQRSQTQHAKIIFGSATPSVDTFYLSTQHQLAYHSLTERFNDNEMPVVEILNLKTTHKNYLIHDRLLEKIELNLLSKQRTLILVNRRGYSSFLKCGACGSIQKCKACDTSYTYHSDGYFRCHRCSSVKRMTRQCMDCGAYDVEYQGVAIQKVEMELQRLYPDASISRIDRDKVKSYADLQQALNQVDHADILIGTQMISKGHNFKNVSLVGMIGVDTLLNFPDFRSSERLFQLITQMAGRAGRDLQSSEVFVQTFQPEHYVFQFSKTHDVDGFLKQEVQFRKPFNYPPFCSLINVIFSSTDPSIIQSLYLSIQTFNRELKKRFDHLQIIGPKVAPIEKVSGYFRHNVFYKINANDLLRFKSYLKKFPNHRKIRLVIDISPHSLL